MQTGGFGSEVIAAYFGVGVGDERRFHIAKCLEHPALIRGCCGIGTRRSAGLTARGHRSLRRLGREAIGTSPDSEGGPKGRGAATEQSTRNALRCNARRPPV